jgi:transposase
MEQYPEVVKARMVRRLAGPEAWSARALADETGIPQPTLSRWLREAGSVVDVSKRKKESGSKSGATEADAGARRPQDLSPLERARVVLQASELGEDELGEFLRHRGLHREQLEQWREALEGAFTSSTRRQRSSENQRVRELEREVARKDKALAEATAIIVLKKKAALLFGEDEDDDMSKKRGR